MKSPIGWYLTISLLLAAFWAAVAALLGAAAGLWLWWR
jgi:hypothetical protein